MKKYTLYDDCFNGYVGMFPRRIILLELRENRHVFETKPAKAFKAIRKYAFMGGIVLLCMLSIMALQRMQVWELAEKSTIAQIYHGSKADVEKNKAKAFQRLEIAGASGTGRIAE